MSEDSQKFTDGQLAAAGEGTPSGDAGQDSYPQVNAATSGASSLSAPKPVGTTAQLADYLVNGFWQYVGEGAHRWASNTITYNINGLNAAEQFLARSALNAWHEVANLTFVETTGAANITFTHNGTMTAYESDYVDGSGYIVAAAVNISADWITNDGGAYDGKTGIDSYGYQTYVHEVGHALGLGHQGPYNGSASYSTGAIYANDTWQYSVMSYFSQPNYGGSYRYVITPQMADIYAAGSIYGAATTRTGDTVYGFNNTAGSIYNFSAYSPAPALTIYDSGGSDTLDASGYSSAQVIDLRAGRFSSVGGLVNNIGIATTTVIEVGIGGSGNDTLIAGDTGSTLKGGGGRDALTGGSGVDRLVGGASVDTMSGGAGADIFVFATSDSSASTGQHDLVSDFTSGTDRFDLSGIDADTSTSGIMDGFRFLATSVFDGVAAALRYLYDAIRGVTVLQGDVNGDQTADFAIDLTGNKTLTSADFTADSLRPMVPLNLSGTSGTDTLNGDWLGDTLYGLSGADTLWGFAGNDTLDGGAGADTMRGGAGDDIYYVDDGSDQVIENAGEGSDTVYTATHLWLAANAETLVLQGSAALQGYGNALANTIIGNSGGNILSGEAGADTLIGGLGNDAYFVHDIGDVVIENAGEGTDNVYIYGAFNYTLGANLENLLLQGSADLQGTGNELNNVIIGNSGNNVLNGGAGADGLRGGAGNDTFHVDNAGDSVVENAGAGTDTVYASIAYTLAANVENLTLTGSSAINATGNALDNVIAGNGGNNALAGGDGNDTAVFSGIWANYAISYDAGTLTYTIVDQRTGSPDGTDTATGIELFRFAGGTLAASALLNRAPTNATLSGGSIAENAANGAVVGTVAGVDPDAAAPLSYSLTDNAGGRFAIHTSTGQLTVANGSLLDYEAAASHAITVRVTDHGGLTFDKVLTLNVTNVNEAPSNATLTGGSVAENAANGTVVGTVAGADPDAGAAFTYSLTGNAGGRFAINATTGQLTVANGSLLDYETTASHAITVRVTDQGGLTFDKALNVALTDVTGLSLSGSNGVNDTLTGAGEEDTLLGLSGVDTLWGLGANDTLDGGAGADVMRGGTGNDTYYVDDGSDQVIENAGEGNDTVYTTTHLWLAANAETLVLQGSANLQGYGNALANTIIGNSGGNILSGEAGADTLIGGLGNDAYFVHDAGDQVIENAGEGTDNVYIYGTLNYTLGANLENLLLQGSADLQGTGNELNNVIYGNSGANTLAGGSGNDTLNGRAGVDTMTGGIGNDAYFVDNAGDQVVENAGEGTDIVYATIDYTLTADVENLLLQGTAGLQGTGNELNNAITGNSGANTLTGGGGNDTMTGGAGNDTFIFKAGFGQDTIGDFTAGSASVDVVEFHDSIFADYAAVMAAAATVGANTVITVDGSTSITLQNVSLASLHQDDFRFI